MSHDKLSLFSYMFEMFCYLTLQNCSEKLDLLVILLFKFGVHNKLIVIQLCSFQL